MERLLKEPTDCRCCAFGQNGCALGIVRAWSGRCDDFQPYCLDCFFPDWLCHTCNNRSQKRLKPGISARPGRAGADAGSFLCTW